MNIGTFIPCHDDSVSCLGHSQALFYDSKPIMEYALKYRKQCLDKYCVVDIKLLLTLWIGQSDTQRQSRQVSRSTEKTLLKNAKNFTTDEALTTPT